MRTWSSWGWERWAAMQPRVLARAGVGKLRLVDFDEVRLSNINRQLYALESTVGAKKCELARGRVLQINPRCEVEALELFVHSDNHRPRARRAA